MAACLWRRGSRHDAFTIGANCAAFAACDCAIAAARESLLAFAARLGIVRCFRIDAIFGLGAQNGQLWRSASLRSEEHTSELQSRGHLVCRLLLEKKKYKIHKPNEQTARDKTRTAHSLTT